VAGRPGHWRPMRTRPRASQRAEQRGRMLWTGMIGGGGGAKRNSHSHSLWSFGAAGQASSRAASRVEGGETNEQVAPACTEREKKAAEEGVVVRRLLLLLFHISTTRRASPSLASICAASRPPATLKRAPRRPARLRQRIPVGFPLDSPRTVFGVLPHFRRSLGAVSAPGHWRRLPEDEDEACARRALRPVAFAVSECLCGLLPVARLAVLPPGRPAVLPWRRCKLAAGPLGLRH